MQAFAASEQARSRVQPPLLPPRLPRVQPPVPPLLHSGCSMEATLAEMRSVIAREEATCDPAVLATIKREWEERVRQQAPATAQGKLRCKAGWHALRIPAWPVCGRRDSVMAEVSQLDAA